MASLLIMADLTRHVLEDTKVWPPILSNGWGAAQYFESATCTTEVFRCLTKVGWIFTVVFTYAGFALLMFGTFWNSNIISKLKLFRAKWRQLRGIN